MTFNTTTGDFDANWSGYINIFVRNISFLGYSPLGGNGNGDGVTIDNNAFGTSPGCTGVSPNNPYNLGRTLTHELGHYLNLNHIWANPSDQGGCSNDDGVADTPLQNSFNTGCPALGIQSCSTNDMHMNYMDYVNDACMYMFSDGQSARMESYVAANLQNVVNNQAAVCVETCSDGIQNQDETGIDCGGTICSACTTLPVELIEFKAKENNGIVHLDWTTASEVNNDYFELQHSKDGINFENIGIIHGQGTSTLTNYYSFIDERPFNGYNFYRLKQIDFNSDFAYSHIISVEYKNEIYVINIHPNPFNQSTTIKFPLTEQNYTNQNIRVIEFYDVFGKLVHQVSSDELITNLNLSRLISGTYFLHIKDEYGNHIKTQRIIKY